MCDEQASGIRTTVFGSEKLAEYSFSDHHAWSDETKINCLGSDGRKWVWKKAGEGLSDRTGGGNSEVWGRMYHGLGMHVVRRSGVCMQGNGCNDGCKPLLQDFRG